MKLSGITPTAPTSRTAMVAAALAAKAAAEKLAQQQAAAKAAAEKALPAKSVLPAMVQSIASKIVTPVSPAPKPVTAQVQAPKPASVIQSIATKIATPALVPSSQVQAPRTAVTVAPVVQPKPVVAQVLPKKPAVTVSPVASIVQSVAKQIAAPAALAVTPTKSAAQIAADAVKAMQAAVAQNTADQAAIRAFSLYERKIYNVIYARAKKSVTSIANPFVALGALGMFNPNLVADQTTRDAIAQTKKLLADFRALTGGVNPPILGFDEAPGYEGHYGYDPHAYPQAIIDGKIFYNNWHPKLYVGNDRRESYFIQDWQDLDWIKTQIDAKKIGPTVYNGVSGFFVDPSLIGDTKFSPLKKTDSYRNNADLNGNGILQIAGTIASIAAMVPGPWQPAAIVVSSTLAARDAVLTNNPLELVGAVLSLPGTGGISATEILNTGVTVKTAVAAANVIQGATTGNILQAAAGAAQLPGIDQMVNNAITSVKETVTGAIDSVTGSGSTMPSAEQAPAPVRDATPTPVGVTLSPVTANIDQQIASVMPPTVTSPALVDELNPRILDTAPAVAQAPQGSFVVPVTSSVSSSVPTAATPEIKIVAPDGVKTIDQIIADVVSPPPAVTTPGSPIVSPPGIPTIDQMIATATASPSVDELNPRILDTVPAVATAPQGSYVAPAVSMNIDQQIATSTALAPVSSSTPTKTETTTKTESTNSPDLKTVITTAGSVIGTGVKIASGVAALEVAGAQKDLIAAQTEKLKNTPSQVQTISPQAATTDYGKLFLPLAIAALTLLGGN